ncbi:hypothetical protein [Rhizobium sp. LC145]|uniref:hypothetical protein n=1 Tax=Rhizobium sp. LC145 TaxID=1120688 RepID=UPI000629E256|nr:hypothetical protein [Rhizobium sp. LC145]KKX28245.1 hypothetical protein YH62_19345 [Rhizobium sp. LC145]TKT58337.1 hypothetical protein FDR95_12070 [Rhizobiaceae bacterium LC148]
MTPDFSPAMLKFFLRARVMHEANIAFPAARASQERGAKVAIRKRAGVTNTEFELAWMGRLMAPVPRAKLWAALGINPGAFGVILMHGGQETSP